MAFSGYCFFKKYLNSGRKLNLNTTFKTHSKFLLDVLHTFNLRPVTEGRGYRGCRDNCWLPGSLPRFCRDKMENTFQKKCQ